MRPLSALWLFALALWAQMAMCASIRAGEPTWCGIEGQPPSPSSFRARGLGPRAVHVGSVPYVTILVRFADSTSVMPNPRSYYDTLMGNDFGGMQDYWREISYGNISLAGSIVVGWYDLPHPKSYYLSSDGTQPDLDKLTQDATSVADADVYFPNFYGVNILFNENVPGASWGGGGGFDRDGVARGYGMTWVQPWGHNTGVMGHEMGHSLGMGHVAGYSWDGENSTNGYYVHKTAYHKLDSGWIPPARQYVVEPGSTQTIELERIALPQSASNYLVAKIPSSLGGVYFTVEARRRVGWDQGLPGEGIVIYRIDRTNNQEPESLNRGDPESMGQGGVVDSTLAGSLWTPGETYTDSNNGIIISVDGATETGYTVTISLTANVTPEVITNTNNGGRGSLRNALRHAAEFSGTQLRFAIPNTDAGFQNGVYTIAPLSPLPEITGADTIVDGATQSGFAGVPIIVVNGASAGEARGLTIRGANCAVKNLVINGFSSHGVQIYGATAQGGTVQGCYIGTNATGTTAVPNRGVGLYISDGAGRQQVGGTSAALRNVISGNANNGLAIYSSSGNNVIQGNYIGTNATGTAGIGNSGHGVDIAFGSDNNTIGGTTAAARNVISGNGIIGLKLFRSRGNTIQGNYIGTNAAGASKIGNGSHGLELGDNASTNLIGGDTRAARNVFSGNNVSGVGIFGTSNDNIVLNNYIGVNAQGTATLGNGAHGVDIAGSSRNRIGGPNTGNVVSGSGGIGVYIRDATSIGNIVQGNNIGTNALGTAAVANTNDGIKVDFGPQDTLIGGSNAGEGNLISGNGGSGVAIFNAATTRTIVRGNSIGTDSSAGSPLPNLGQGVIVGHDAAQNTVGGTAAGQGNRIAFNSQDGVRIFSTGSIGNAVRGNAIWGNGRLGINLDGGSQNGSGVNSNDTGDTDTGPNALQNFPTITGVSSTGGTTTISGVLNSTAGTTYAIDCFGNTSGDASAFGEGQAYLGSVTTTTDAGGKASFAFTLTGNLAGQIPTATATNLSTGNTSEYSFLGLSHIVTHTGDSGYGSLRNAIDFANQAPGTTIRFAIPTSDANYTNGVFSIKPISGLPVLTTDGTVIDGATQPGFAGAPLIEINGVNASSGTNGLLIQAAHCVVNNLIINRFSDGIQFRNATAFNNRVQGCYIGTDATGTVAAANRASGVAILSGAHDNTIGGTATAARNILSGNANGVWIYGPGTDTNTVRGNYIGTDTSGLLAVPNSSRGVMIVGGAQKNTIGGTAVGAPNVISGNGGVGVGIADPGTSNNSVQGNYIGTDASGLVTLENRGDGIGIWNRAANNVIGGTTVAARNIISGNLYSGVAVGNLGTNGNLVQGNYIGTDATGVSALANAREGVAVYGGAQGNTIGGTSSSARNVISANTLRGILIADSGTSNNIVRGNYIGTNAAGDGALGNGYEGVTIISGASSNIVGGTNSAARNLIAGNQRSGVWVSGSGTDSNVIQGNSIGTDAGGTQDLGNGAEGVIIVQGATKTVVGGTAAGVGNRIAFNRSAGVKVWDAATLGTSIRGNAIYSNGEIGINLVGNDGAYGVTANDATDTDTGPSNLQNYPVFTAVNAVSGTTTISGVLNSTPNTQFSLDFYSSPTADVSSYGEGKTYLGLTSVTTNSSGNASFSFSNSSAIANEFVTATATDSSGNTSEFSHATKVAAFLSVNDVGVAEGNPAQGAPGTNNATFTVTFPVASTKPITVSYATADGTAKQPGDYTGQSGTLTFAPGDLSKTITVPVVGDTLEESSETFLVNLSNATNASIGDAQGVGTIHDNDTVIRLAVSDVSVTETNGGSTQAAFVVSLSAVSTKSVTVVVQSASNAGSPVATVGRDYSTLPPTTLTFAPGQTSKTVNVTILGDTLDEADEKFAVNLSGAVNATISDSSGICTILDNDATPSVSVSAPTVVEGNSGNRVMTFSISLSAASARTVSVQYKTANASAHTATAGMDYISVPLSTATFLTGETLKTVNVTVKGDTLDEENERIALALSAPTNASIGIVNDGYIQDDDAIPTLAINNISVAESNGGTTQAAFTLTLSAASGRSVTVIAQTASGGSPAATAGADYTAIAPTTVTFNPGQTTRHVSITVMGDVIDESDEKFVVNLTGATNVSLSDNSGLCTILDNDAPPTITASALNVTEGRSGGTAVMAFTIRLSAPSARTVSVRYQTVDATTLPATAGTDYVVVGSSTALFAAGETTKTVNITVRGDVIDEENEHVGLSLTNPVNAGLGTVADGIIVDDDAAPSLSINDRNLVERQGGTALMTFTVTLSALSAKVVTVNVQSVAGGSPPATAGIDYVALPATLLTFGRGETTKTVSVSIKGDTTVESDEKFSVVLSGASNATLGDGSGTGTILNDDAVGFTAPSAETAPSADETSGTGDASSAV